MADTIKESMPGYPQGEPAFVGMLKEHTAFVPHWDDVKCGKNELDAKAGIRLDAAFPDPEKLDILYHCTGKEGIAGWVCGPNDTAEFIRKAASAGMPVLFGGRESGFPVPGLQFAGGIFPGSVPQPEAYAPDAFPDKLPRGSGLSFADGNIRSILAWKKCLAAHGICEPACILPGIFPGREDDMP